MIGSSDEGVFASAAIQGPHRVTFVRAGSPLSLSLSLSFVSPLVPFIFVSFLRFSFVRQRLFSAHFDLLSANCSGESRPPLANKKKPARFLSTSFPPNASEVFRVCERTVSRKGIDNTNVVAMAFRDGHARQAASCPASWRPSTSRSTRAWNPRACSCTRTRRTATSSTSAPTAR